jgi:intracellular multiplication protein IcmG
MDKKNNNSDEEYKLQDSTTESASHFSGVSSSPDPASAILEKTQRHLIFLIVFIILASLGIYKVVGTLVHRMHATSQPKVVAKAQKSAIPVIPAAVQANMALDNRFNHLEQEQRELQAHLQAFDSDLNDIKATLADLNSRLDGMNEQTQLLRSQQEAFLQKQQKAETKLTERKKSAPKPIYYVRAIIPGRVWLTLQDGSTLTLGMGDKLAGYGDITAIDPNQGTITLSSGAIIGYNPDDR